MIFRRRRETVRANTDLTTYLPHDDKDMLQYVFETIGKDQTISVEGEHLIYARYLRLIEKYSRTISARSTKKELLKRQKTNTIKRTAPSRRND